MFEGPIQQLIDELASLPGLGPKGAQRIAFHVIGMEPEAVETLEGALAKVRTDLRFCEICGNLAAAATCRICSDPARDLTSLCVVEEPKDIVSVERTREFRGRYHVLGGALDPINGIGADDLRIRELMRRLGTEVPGPDRTPSGEFVAEVIIATDLDAEGEATAAYLVRLMRDFPGLRISRPASGLPLGSDIEFANELTLGRAFAGRRSVGADQGRADRGPAEYQN